MLLTNEIACPPEEIVDDYLATRLNVSERAAVELHLDDCESCRGLVAELVRVPPTAHDHGPASVQVGTQAIRIGDVIAKTYQLEAYLGRGGFGAVYQAQHLRLPRKVAIKIISAVLLEKPTALARFENEAKIACAMRHENIVEVFDCNRTANGHPYLVMELLEGETLADRILGSPLDLAETTQIIDQICSALELIHSRGVVHRDLKPANIFLCTGSRIRAKLLDFGLAKVLEDPGLTKTGLLIGTPRYMSPEHIRRQEGEIGPASDVFSMAAIAFECLTGKPAFKGEALMEVLDRVCHREPDLIQSVNPNVPAKVALVLARALNKQPSKRHQSIALLASEFSLASGMRPPPAAVHSTPLTSSLDTTLDRDMLATTPRDGSDRHSGYQTSSKRRRSRARIAFGFIAAILVVVAVLAVQNMTGSPTIPVENPTPSNSTVSHPNDVGQSQKLRNAGLNGSNRQAASVSDTGIDAAPLPEPESAETSITTPTTSPQRESSTRRSRTRKSEKKRQDRKAIGPIERTLD